MNKKFMMFFAAALFITVQVIVNAQDDPRPFNPLAESVANAIQEQFPGWRRVSVPPINFERPDSFSEEVIIDQWSSDEASVRVAILIHPSKEAAKETLRHFAADVRADGVLPDVGNEAYAWGIDKSVAFRKGVYTVYVSGVRYESSEDGEPIDPTAFSRETKYVKTFAQIVAKALKDSD